MPPNLDELLPSEIHFTTRPRKRINAGQANSTSWFRLLFKTWVFVLILVLFKERYTKPDPKYFLLLRFNAGQTLVTDLIFWRLFFISGRIIANLWENRGRTEGEK